MAEGGLEAATPEFLRVRLHSFGMRNFEDLSQRVSPARNRDGDHGDTETSGQATRKPTLNTRWYGG